MLKTPSCPWRWCPAAGLNLETGHLSRHYIAEISLNVTLNHNQQQQLNNICKLCSVRSLIILLKSLLQGVSSFNDNIKTAHIWCNFTIIVDKVISLRILRSLHSNVISFKGSM